MSKHIYQAYRAVPFRFLLRKARYYDICETGIEDESTNLLCQRYFVPYPGLPLQYQQTQGATPTIAISHGELPNHVKIDETCYCLAPHGATYTTMHTGFYNFKKIGYPSIDRITGVVTALSAQDYVECNSAIVFDRQEWECTCHLKTGSDVMSDSIIIGEPNDKHGFRINISNGHFVFLCGRTSWFNTSASVGILQLTPNTEYIIKAGYRLSDSTYYLRYQNANAEWIDDITYNSSTSIYTFAPRIGANHSLGFGDGTIYLADISLVVGSVEKFDFNNCVDINCAGILAKGLHDDGTAQSYNLFYNGEYILDTVATKKGYMWCGEISIPQHDAVAHYKTRDNWQLYGDVDYKHYWLSNFNINGHIRSDYIFTPQAEQSWCWQVKFRCDIPVAAGTQAIMTTEILNHGPYIGINSAGKLCCGLASNGDVIAEVASSDSITADTDYWVRLEHVYHQPDFFNVGGWGYILQYSTDGEHWVTTAFLETEQDPIVATRTMRLGYCDNGIYFHGQIDVRETYIRIGSQTTWGIVEKVTTI